MRRSASDVGGRGMYGRGYSYEESRPVDNFKLQLNKMVAKVDELEQRVSNVSQFYSSLKKKRGGAVTKNRDRERHALYKNLIGPARRESATKKSKQELMRQLGTILRQHLMQHKWAKPFMEPVDVKGLGLHDYYEIIETPMDFTTVRNKMEAKDGTGYSDVLKACADIRLIFKNAMTYNDVKNHIHHMAKTLLEIFEEKLLELLPGVVEEEAREKEEEIEPLSAAQLVQEAETSKMARDISNELYELDSYLDELREIVVQNCRKMSTEEKRKLGIGLSRLSTDDLEKAIEIIAQKNPHLNQTAEEVDIDIDAQSESTLWRLKFFVKSALEVQAKNAAVKENDNSKRKREICDAVARTNRKRSKRLSSY